MSKLASYVGKKVGNIFVLHIMDWKHAALMPYMASKAIMCGSQKFINIYIEVTSILLSDRVAHDKRKIMVIALKEMKDGPFSY